MGPLAQPTFVGTDGDDRPELTPVHGRRGNAPATKAPSGIGHLNSTPFEALTPKT